MEIRRCAQYLTFRPFVARQNPKAVAIRVKNNIVDVPDCSRRKCVGNLPAFSAIGGRVDMNLRPFAIAEILTPVNGPIGDDSDVQRPSAVLHAVSHSKFIATGNFCNDRARNSGNQGWIVVSFPGVTGRTKNGEGMKAVAHQAVGESVAGR